MNTLLVLSVGQADVQIVVNGKRHAFVKNETAKIHEALAQLDPGAWTLVDSGREKAKEEVSSLPADRPIALCTPRLDAVRRLAKDKGLTFTHALILGTQRGSQHDKQDPNHAGPILARRLKEDHGPDAWVKSYITGDGKLDNAKEPKDALVHRDVVKRVDEEIRMAMETSCAENIYVVATGGITPVTALTVNIVRMRAKAPAKVMWIDIPDAARSSGDHMDRAVLRAKIVPTPHASFEARKAALDLIREGHLIAAWGAVKHLHDDPSESNWTSVIELLYKWASSLDLETCRCKIPMLTDKHPRAIDAAMRVEFALRAGDIPRAVHGTAALVEAAMWDHLMKRATLCRGKTDVYTLNPAPEKDLITDKPYGNKFEPFVRVTGGYEVAHRAPSYRRIINEYFKSPSATPKLSALENAISIDIRKLRNDVAHGIPTPEQMIAATKKMQDANLWSKQNGFLCQPLVREALKELNVSDPEKLCDALVAEVEQRLTGYVYGAGST